jgi:hypothetical protein
LLALQPFIKTEIQKDLFKDQIKKAKAKMQRPRWSNFNIYVSDCVKEDPITGDQRVDIMRLRQNKFQSLLTELIDGLIIV